MRVTILGIKTLPAYAGADRVVERLVEHLPEHEYTIYLASNTQTKLANTPTRRYVYLPALRGKHLRAFSFFLVSALHFALRGNADVVHVHNSDFGIFCWIVKLRRHVPIIGTFHGRPYLRRKWGLVARSFLRLSEVAFVRACTILTSVAEMELRHRYVRFVPNGAEATTTEPGSFDFEGHGITRGKYVLFACGRLDSTKGLHHLLDAFHALADERNLLVIGDFGHDADYSAMIERAAERDPRVVLVRRLLDRGSLYEVLRNCAVFVFPSEYEAMSMMLLEAISCRATVVCSDIPENVAVVGREYPLLFKSKSSASLREAIARADEGNIDIDAVYDGVIGRFRWEAVARQYDAIYREAASVPELVVTSAHSRDDFPTASNRSTLT